MTNKKYRPILREGEHLVQSKTNEHRVRGVSQDSYNRVTDIVEWEEVDDDYGFDHSYSESDRLNQARDASVKESLIGLLSVIVVVKLSEHIIMPWWTNKAKPFFKEKFNRNVSTESESTIEIVPSESIKEAVDVMIDRSQYEMSHDAYEAHLRELVFAMMRFAYEYRILSQAVFVDSLQSEENFNINQQDYFEVSERIISEVDRLLAHDCITLSQNTEKIFLDSFGGGFKSDGIYLPVQISQFQPEDINHPGSLF